MCRPPGMENKGLAYSGALLSAGDPHRPARDDRAGVSPAAVAEAGAVPKASKSSWGNPQGPGDVFPPPRESDSLAVFGLFRQNSCGL